MRRIAALICLSVLATGCASLSPAGQRVRVTANADVVRSCEFVGNVKASSTFGGPVGGNMGEDQVEIKMQNETAELGGNVLFLTSNRAGGFGGLSRGIGEAYKCATKTN
jgi:Domain of unknown function (DUF4156)